LINNFSTLITKGDKIGIIGANGVGKTTLIRLLLGEIQPATGTVRQGQRLEVCYFDQLREQLDLDKTVMFNLAEGNDQVTVNGRQRHVISYLQDFMFTPDRAKSPVSQLSGGERARLLLAKLFLQPANVLVLDEPTNDLDIQTLELLEEMVADFSGTVLMVSHDRAFINNVATSTLVFEDDGSIQEYAGGYDDWLQQRQALFPDNQEKKEGKRATPAEKKTSAGTKARKLKYKEKIELDALPELIEKLESEQEELQCALADPELYKNNPTRVPTIKSRLDKLTQELENAYARWEELDALPK
jgi:ABC transport system ATP-binding/permease protein